MSTVRQNKIREHYDSIADTYDNHYDGMNGKPYYEHISSFLLDALPRGGNLLDVGCGTGLFLRQYLADGTGTATGVDISRNMVELAYKRCSPCNLTVGTADRLPFRDGSFDAVSSMLVFTYLKHPEGMLTEAYRVLRPGGSIGICTLGKKLVTRGIPALYHISEKMKIKHVVMKNFGERYYDGREMQELFSEVGFDNITVRWCSFAHINIPGPLFRIARKMEPFVERRIPQLAYNICVTAKKPE